MKITYDICVIGLGYIGLPTATIFASRNKSVLGVDTKPEIVEIINSGNIHFEEPDLDVLVRASVNSGQLKASLTPQPADTFILAVPTPFKEYDGRKIPDTSHIEKAVRSIATVVREGNLVILESTSPVGTTEKVKHWLKDELARMQSPVDADRVFFAHCPERVLPGQIMKELIQNHRIVGGIDAESSQKAGFLYQSFCEGNILYTNARTAELAKLAENASRDVSIAFANELSMICDKLNIDTWELIKLANHHPRVNILNPGPGVGGHCIAVDPYFIVESAPEESKLIRTAREVNDSKTQYVLDKILQSIRTLKNARVACLGISFKANVDDLRGSPAITIMKKLLEQAENEAEFMVVEPHITQLPNSLAAAQLVELDQALQNSNLIVLLVDHSEFAEITENQLENRIVIDTRGLLKTR